MLDYGVGRFSCCLTLLLLLAHLFRYFFELGCKSTILIRNCLIFDRCGGSTTRCNIFLLAFIGNLFFYELLVRGSLIDVKLGIFVTFLRFLKLLGVALGHGLLRSCLVGHRMDLIDRNCLFLRCFQIRRRLCLLVKTVLLLRVERPTGGIFVLVVLAAGQVTVHPVPDCRAHFHQRGTLTHQQPSVDGSCHFVL